MLFKTQLELNITIKDINAIYATNYEQMLMDHARLMYERKCRDGQYIKSIDKLIRRSLPNLIRRDLSAKVRVYIAVEATAIRYDQYDFITGMVVQKIIPAGKIGNFDMLECRNDHVVALMQLRKDADKFTVGDTIPLRVGASMYKIGNEHILINGVPFIPIEMNPVQFTLDKLNAETKDHFKKMIKPLLDREIARKDALDSKRWESFAKLLHPYKTTTKLTNGVDIMNIDSIEKGTFGVDYHSNLSDLQLSINAPKASESITIVSQEPKSALTRLVFPFVKWLSTINDLTEQYHTDELYHNIDHIWELYMEHKL